MYIVKKKQQTTNKQTIKDVNNNTSKVLYRCLLLINILFKSVKSICSDILFSK